MNRKQLAFLLFMLAGSLPAFSQARLQIVSLSGFPSLPTDTAYGGTPYPNIFITVKNVGNVTYNDGIDIFLMANPARQDTLLLDSTIHLLAPNDTIRLHAFPPYQFTSVVFDGGDNIVVVWPEARTVGVSSDTLTTEVYYVSAQGISGPELNPLTISPNPSSQFIHLNFAQKNLVKYVRIYDSIGDLVYEQTGISNLISIADFRPGIYFIELIQEDEVHRIGKILKY